MKCLILSFLFPLSLFGQNMFMEKDRLFALQMNTREVNEFNVLCVKDTTVVWGTNQGDTTCFMFNGMVKCFWPVSKMVWEREDDPKVKRLVGLDPRADVRQDRFNEKYSILFVTSEKGLIILISNIDHGTPSYVFIWCPGKDDECWVCD
jgi:hypothetical protein